MVRRGGCCSQGWSDAWRSRFPGLFRRRFGGKSDESGTWRQPCLPGRFPLRQLSLGGVIPEPLRCRRHRCIKGRRAAPVPHSKRRSFGPRRTQSHAEPERSRCCGASVRAGKSRPTRIPEICQRVIMPNCPLLPAVAHRNSSAQANAASGRLYLVGSGGSETPCRAQCTPAIQSNSLKSSKATNLGCSPASIPG